LEINKKTTKTLYNIGPFLITRAVFILKFPSKSKYWMKNPPFRQIYEKNQAKPLYMEHRRYGGRNGAGAVGSQLHQAVDDFR
jgi:hypothetical protein